MGPLQRRDGNQPEDNIGTIFHHGVERVAHLSFHQKDSTFLCLDFSAFAFIMPAATNESPALTRLRRHTSDLSSTYRAMECASRIRRQTDGDGALAREGRGHAESPPVSIQSGGDSALCHRTP